MTLNQTGLACVIAASASAAVVYYCFPQVHTKTIEITKEVVKTDIKTVVHTITLPNGQTETTTTTTDHSVKVDTDKKTSIVNLAPNWLVSGTAQTNFRLEAPAYGLQIQRRVLGPVFIGALLNTNGDIGLSLGLEF